MWDSNPEHCDYLTVHNQFHLQPVTLKYINYHNILLIPVNQMMSKFQNQYQLTQTYSLNAGLKKFEEKGWDAALGETKQLHDRRVFKPIDASTLSALERRRALESLIFLVEKKDNRIQTSTNGNTQREYVNQEDARSPTAATESIHLTAAIDAEEGRDVMTVDIPNAFVQTDLDLKKSKSS
jgi:hypothetical protein